MAQEFQDEFLLVPLAVELYIEYYKDGIAVKPVFRYDDIAFNPLRELPAQPAGRVLVRDDKAEQRVRAIFAAYDFEVRADQYVQPD